MGRPSRVNYPSEEILPADDLLGYMEPIGIMYGNAPRITRRWVGFLPDGTPCFYISARKAWREFNSNYVPEAEDLSMGDFLTEEVLVTLRHFNPAFVGDPPRFLLYEPGSAASANTEVPYQGLLNRIGGFTGITGLTVPPGSLDPEVNSSP